MINLSVILTLILLSKQMTKLEYDIAEKAIENVNSSGFNAEDGDIPI